MTKRTRGFEAVASLSVRLAAPLLVAALVASCGNSSSSGSSDNSTTGGGAGGQSSSASVSSATGGGEASTSTGNTSTGCISDADCSKEPADHRVCDASTGYCVGCLPGSDTCAPGQFCEPATNACVIGCKNTADCGAGDLLCDLATHTCVGCIGDNDCPAGSVCATNQVCVAGCSPSHACPTGATCCSNICYDVKTNIGHCGDCSIKCAAPPNAAAVCVDGVCGMGACDPVYTDCDGDAANGCERNTLQDGACLCTPLSQEPCYLGPLGTQGVGPCKSGMRTCNAAGTAYGSCVGQVLPLAEICGNSVDDDCNGTVDEADLDGDGWTACQGDCCETLGPGCFTPKLVNPGAFEVLNNGVDDDCDPATQDAVEPPCSEIADFTGVTAADVAKAIDICQTTTADAPLPLKKWGLLTSVQLLANGAAPSDAALNDIQNKQTAILTEYGVGNITPRKGPTMAGISSGVMRDQFDPGYAGISNALTTISQPPDAYLAAHGGALPSSAGCSGTCPAGAGANDSVNIRLQIRVPTNAKSFSYDFRFFSSEYWTFQCSIYNDFYLALLKSTVPGIPTDKNISFDEKKNPISVNNGFFDVCVPQGCNTCPGGVGELAGTGMQLNNTGGATKWLTTDAPIVPGETMQIELMIFDVTDSQFNSVAVLDNFRWKQEGAAVGTHE